MKWIFSLKTNNTLGITWWCLWCIEKENKTWNSGCTYTSLRRHEHLSVAKEALRAFCWANPLRHRRSPPPALPLTFSMPSSPASRYLLPTLLPSCSPPLPVRQHPQPPSKARRRWGPLGNPETWRRRLLGPWWAVGNRFANIFSVEQQLCCAIRSRLWA